MPALGLDELHPFCVLSNPEAVGVGNNPDAIPLVRGADGRRRDTIPLRIVPALGQLPENTVEPPPSSKESCNVLQEEEVGSYSAKQSRELEVEPRPLAGDPRPLAGGADVLAGEAGGPDVPPVGDAGESEREGEPSDPGEEMALGIRCHLVRSEITDVAPAHVARLEPALGDAPAEHLGAVFVDVGVQGAGAHSVFTPGT